MRRLQSSSSGQFALELVRAKGLDVAVAADVLLGNEDVGHAPLVGDLLEGVLDGSAVVCVIMLASVRCSLYSVLRFASPAPSSVVDPALLEKGHAGSGLAPPRARRPSTLRRPPVPHGRSKKSAKYPPEMILTHRSGPAPKPHTWLQSCSTTPWSPCSTGSNSY